MRRPIAFLSFFLAAAAPLAAQTAATHDTTQPHFTHADSLRGGIDNPGRRWWDVAFYDLDVRVHPADSSIAGTSRITYRVTGPRGEMQIDLQEPLVADSMMQDGRAVTHRRDGNAYFATLASPQPVGARKTITIWYHGRPRVAKRAPWDGGFVWTADSLGHPWIATAVQGLGASAWWPTKDTQADEPDSARIRITVPSAMQDVSNGRLRRTTTNADGTTTYEWFVADPINNYDIAVNAGTYAHFSDTYAGEGGTLTLDFYPLAYHADTARKQFAQAKPMIACFEHWFGPYPWYRDGYKLVETPHLGMEHQSAVAYGNHYLNGYLGRDRSRTGYGMKWDFIIVHESGHEWFGNSITAKDIADMWIHEGFTTYAENLYTECQQGKAAGAAYVIGQRANIRNDKPIVGTYGVNDEGSGDMYDKTANMLHTMRQIVNDDAKWRDMLRGLNRTFFHQTVTGAQIEAYVSRSLGRDFTPLFRQYLTTTMIPTLEYATDSASNVVRYHWTNVVPGFSVPLRARVGTSDWMTLTPSTEWQTMAGAGALEVDRNYYVVVKKD